MELHYTCNVYIGVRAGTTETSISNLMYMYVSRGIKVHGTTGYMYMCYRPVLVCRVNVQAVNVSSEVDRVCSFLYLVQVCLCTCAWAKFEHV